MTRTLKPLILNTGALALTLILIYTGISAHDKLTWLMEVTPVIIVVPLLLATAKRYPLTPLLYTLIFFHAIILMVGGQYTYAKVPIGFEVQEWLGLSRNPYDKLGHFFQGLVPALVAREILVRGMYVRGRKMVAFLVCCVALAISAMYELIEWWAALAMGQGADDFLGTQGDQWDTQSDMFCALLGALTTVIFLARFHCRQLRRFVDAGCGVNSLSGLQNLQIQSITLRRGLINISHQAIFVSYCPRQAFTSLTAPTGISA